jgi:putative phage-type endonuclease
MIKYHYDVLQGTDEWLELRLGIITGSTVKTLLTPTGKVSKDKKVINMAHDMAAQRITARIEESYMNEHMERGHIEEELAKSKYRREHNMALRDCGFVTNTNHGFPIGYSPDGLVEEDGLVECKSRLAKFQIETISLNEVPKEYNAQMQMGLLVTEREYCDFIQYSNGMPMFVKRVERDEPTIEAIKEACSLFEERVQKIIEDYKANVASLNLKSTEWVDHQLGDTIA